MTSDAPPVPWRTPGEPSLEGRRVLLVGGYGCGNLGDEAILAGLLFLREAWDATVVSLDPGHTVRTHGVRAVAPWGFPRALARADAVVIGGGGIFSRYMGPRARAIPACALAARALGKDVEFTALGAYVGTPTGTAKLLAAAVERADRVTVRDAASRRFLRACGVRRPLEVVPDPSLALPPSPPGRARAILRERAPAALDGFVAFAVRRVLDPVAQARVAPALAGAARWLRQRSLEPLFVPLSRHPSRALEDDAAFAREIAQAAGAGAVLDGDLHPREAMAILGEAEAVVAMRLHGMLFALRMRRPLVGLPYDAKCRSALRTAGVEPLEPRRLRPADLVDRLAGALAGSPGPEGRVVGVVP